ncbi:MAG: hypothetical protein RLZZ555_2147 [Pseudomonadota bacterium]|jgi:hypothetical protein
MTESITAAFTDDDYLSYNPFEGEEADLKCRTVAIRTARKQHRCFTLNGRQDHTIEPGERYRYERALVDSSFWGEYRICLNCMDEFLGDIHGDGADDADD